MLDRRTLVAPPAAAGSFAMEGLESRWMLAAHAIAHLVSAPGLDIHGIVQFKEVEGGVEVKVNVHGLTPGKHGFHVHAGTVCDPNDPAGPFVSAGGHFNPTGEPHGSPDSTDHHAGDLGNLVADRKGKAKATFVVHDVSLDGPNGFAGHALIIHANPDDLTTQPTGNSGGRIACGIIEPTGQAGAPGQAPAAAFSTKQIASEDDLF